MPPANNSVAAFVAGWRCAYPAYTTRRPVQAKRRRANQATMRPDALSPTTRSTQLIFHPEKGTFSP